MPDMTTLVPLILGGLVLLVLIWTFLRFQLGHGARVVLRGLGAIIMLAGLYFSGLALLAGNGLRSIYDWAQRTKLSNTMIVGFSLLAAGALFWLVGTLLRPRTREDAKARREVKKGSQPAVAAKPAPAQPAPAKPAPKAATSDEDREIEELLRNRGIE